MNCNVFNENNSKTNLLDFSFSDVLSFNIRRSFSAVESLDFSGSLEGGGSVALSNKEKTKLN